MKDKIKEIIKRDLEADDIEGYCLYLTFDVLDKKSEEIQSLIDKEKAGLLKIIKEMNNDFVNLGISINTKNGKIDLQNSIINRNITKVYNLLNPIEDILK